MAFPFREALKAGAEFVAAWADYLDEINVFPVADGDTGRNLVLSLAPLRNLARPHAELVRDLLIQARGNSGNLASQFLVGLLEADAWEKLAAAAARGSELARQAIPEPKAGTILSFFAALAAQLAQQPDRAPTDDLGPLLDALEKTVRDTTAQLAKLQAAGVVDAGALGMFFFFEGFFRSLAGQPADGESRFQHALSRRATGRGRVESGFCIDAALRADGRPSETGSLADLGDSVVTMRRDGILKIHFHTDDAATARARLAELGAIVQFSADDLREQTARLAAALPEPALHIMTDAAGSATRADAERYGFTLADSYIQIGDQSLPETYVDPDALYRAMREGVPVATSQASIYERHQVFRKVLAVHGRALYLCVGSVYTGNCTVARQWKKAHDPEDRLIVLDTSAASGRLGLVAIAAARFSLQAGDRSEVLNFAVRAAERCEEYIFIDRLKFLAAGGRLPKAVSIVGDMLSRKPVVSPMAEGVKPIAWVKNRKAQLAFALARLVQAGDVAAIMLEYADNRDWVAGEARAAIAARAPAAEIILQPFSLTTGVHVGPGSWGVAILPRIS